MIANRKKTRWSNALFVAPFLAVYVCLLVYPLLAGMGLSLFKADLFGGGEFVGLENFSRLLRDAVFRQSVANTFYFVLLTVPPLTVVPLFLALLLNRTTRVAAFFRGVFFSSSVLSVTIVTLIWRMILMADGGLVANIRALFGAGAIPFLSDPRLVMISMAIITVWWCLGLPMMLYLSALQQVPKDIYEAAALDNASWFRTLWSITLPSVSRTVILVAIFQCVLQFQLFGQPQLITQGGPNGASRSIVLFIFEIGFRRWDIGYAAAASQILFAIILIATVAQYLVTRQRATLKATKGATS
ncbi:sugar ABC transporter permease [Asticcacaulis sp. 201]|uniref:carbohydrate ABC transporter permease n=1 Tax=Asticcacaulis sp. 201 TaxID=3028787 RepID=UPI0029168C39|nr:sugar ABC transporter permease [Asticcacaulis sp. 201]MDV6331951.1 sugar ABC transporter permease [Asticcacaulis sp. 201]